MKIKYKLAMLSSFAFLLLHGCTRDVQCVVENVSNDKILTKDLNGKKKIFVLGRSAPIHKYMPYIQSGDTLYFNYVERVVNLRGDTLYFKCGVGVSHVYDSHDVIYYDPNADWLLYVSDAKKRQIKQAKKQHEFDSLFAIMQKEQQDGLGR